MEKFQSTLKNVDFGLADVTVAAGTWSKIGSYVVPAGEELSLGYEKYATLESAIGRIYAKFQTSVPAEIVGKIRLSVWSPQDRPLEILYEGVTENTAGSTAKNLQMPLPEHAVNIREDQKLVMEFYSAAGASISNANTTLLIDCTKYVV